MVEGAAMSGVTGLIDFADRANMPLAVDTYVSEMMTFKASFPRLGMGIRERGINRYAMNSARGLDFVSKFNTLDS